MDNTTNYLEISDEDKLFTLQQSPMHGAKIKSLDQKKWCLHCRKFFVVRDVKAYFDSMSPTFMLECPHPDCNGCPMDWFDKEI